MHIEHPNIPEKNEFALYYRVYLYILAFSFRKLIELLIPDAGLHDLVATVPTPGYGGGTCTIQLYHPRFHSAKKKKLPLVVNLEGGGFCAGSPKTGAKPCRYTSDHLKAVVVSVDYAKSPRYPYPHALMQVPFVIKWAAENISDVDVSNITIGGISAGANLAASFAILFGCVDSEKVKDDSSLTELPKECRLCTMYLLCPSLNQSVPYKTRLENATSLEVKKKSLPSWVASGMEDTYLPPPISRLDPTVSPSLVSPDMLEKAVRAGRFPQTVVIMTAELDCLTTEGGMFADTLKEAGVIVHHKEWKGVTHGFTQDWPKKGINDQSDGFNAWKETVEFLHEAVGSQSV